MIAYLKLLLTNYQYYRRLKRLNVPLLNNKLSSSTYLKYMPQEDFGGRKVLNIGAGGAAFKAPNVVNLDITPGDGINVVWDCSKTPLPFEDNTFDHIIANHVMEHIPNWFECMKEMARIVKVGGTIEIWTPPVSSDAALTYRDHINFIGTESFAGCRTIKRPGSNLAATEEFNNLKDFKNLVIDDKKTRTIVTWWVLAAPQCVLSWMATHLRNIVTEEGFFFRKLP